ncbi:transcript variant X2 [Nothobranchius furzeri]|uniref:Transcript variant X2 n=1 Tax=Nothobranchius furzeri TaxID=105023 RepID=A0A9D3BYV0_NOTFU|nr:transcript variant X2 [Nothobranchius furzeri]
MAAGVLISRILLLCLISDVNHSFAFPSGGHKKGRKQILNYGNRRPLDYIRHLRQPSVNLHSYGLVRTRQPSKNLLRDLSPPSLPLMKTRFQRPHGPKVMFPFQPGPLRNHPSAQPRSLQINVDIPFLNLGKQNENDYIPGFDTEPVHSTDQMQSGSSTPKYAPEKTVYVKDPYQKKTSEVSKSTILFNLSIPLSTSLKPLKSHIPVEKSQTLLSMYVPNQYAEPAKQDHSTTQTGSTWSTFNQATREPMQTGSKRPTYNKVTQEQFQTGSERPIAYLETLQPSQTGSQWPAFNQATQEPVQPGSQWPAFNQAPQEPVQPGSQWPAFNQATQEPVQTGSQWPAFNQATQEPVQTGSKKPTYNKATQEPVQTGSQWPAFNQATQEPMQTGSKKPTYNQATQEPVQTGSQWPAFNQATQEPVQTGSQWPAFNQATQEPMQTGSKKPTYNKVTQEPVQTGSQWPAFNQATQEPVQTGSQWPAFNQAIQEPMQTGSKKPTYNKATQEPVQTGSQWPAVNQATQEPKQTGSQRPAYNRATLEQSQTGSEWPSVNRVVTQHPSQTRSKWPTYNQEKRQPSQIGSQWSTYSKTTQEQSRPNPVRTWQTKEHKNTGNGNLEKPARQPWGLQMQSTRKPSLPILKYFKNSDIYRPQTSLGEKDFVIKPDLSKLKLSSPMQFGSNPSNAEIQGGFGNSGADVKEELMEQEQEQKFSSPTIKLGFTFPVVGKLQNITQSNGGYVFNINPENTGSFSEVAKSLQTGSKWPILSFEAVQQKPNEQTEKKRPHLNFDTILQQNKQPEPVGTPPTSGKPSWNSYQQVNQDNTPSGPSWGVQTSEMNKLQSPVLPVSKYQELIDPEHAHKGPTVQPNPSQPEAVQSQHHNTWVKLGSDDNQSQIRPSGSLTFTIEHDGLFKTPIEPWQTAVDFSKLDASPAIYEAKPPHKWQKPLFPKFYPYNSGQETSQSPTKSPGQDTERNLEGSGKSVKLSITADGAADAVDGQTIFPSHSSHLEFPSKWDAAGTALNLPSSSSSNSEQDSFNLNPPYQSKPQSETIDVARKPQKLEQSYNFQVNYYPSSEKTVSFPSNAFQHVLSGAVPHSIQSLFQTKHNNDQRQQSAKYNQPQNHVPVRSSW